MARKKGRTLHRTHLKKARKEKPAVNKERALARKQRQERVILTWGVVLLSLIVVAFLAYALWPKPSPYVRFAQCVTEAGAIMYGTDWCSHCQEQKRMFGTAFKEIAFVNCDYGKSCDLMGVEGYPTWIFADSTRLEGKVSLEELSDKTGCQLPKVIA